LNWIVQHTELQSLSFNDCIILHQLVASDDGFHNHEYFDTNSLAKVGSTSLPYASVEAREGNMIFGSKLRWDAIFTELPLGLPLLVDLQLDNKDGLDAFDNRHANSLCLPEHRYAAINATRVEDVDHDWIFAIKAS